MQVLFNQDFFSLSVAAFIPVHVSPKSISMNWMLVISEIELFADSTFYRHLATSTFSGISSKINTHLHRHLELGQFWFIWIHIKRMSLFAVCQEIAWTPPWPVMTLPFKLVLLIYIQFIWSSTSNQSLGL